MINEQAGILGPVRPFKRFYVGPKAAVTGIAPVQAIPTVAAQWVIINNSIADTSSAGNSSPTSGGFGAADFVFIESIGMFLTSGTPGAGASLWVALFTAPVTGTLDTGMAIQNAYGGTALSSVVVKSGVTIATPAAPAWYPIDFSPDSTTPAAYSTGYQNAMVNRGVNGRIGIAPGTGLALAVVGPAGTTPLYAPFALWTQQQAFAS